MLGGTPQMSTSVMVVMVVVWMTKKAEKLLFFFLLQSQSVDQFLPKSRKVIDALQNLAFIYSIWPGIQWSRWHYEHMFSSLHRCSGTRKKKFIVEALMAAGLLLAGCRAPQGQFVLGRDPRRCSMPIFVSNFLSRDGWLKHHGYHDERNLLKFLRKILSTTILLH